MYDNPDNIYTLGPKGTFSDIATQKIKQLQRLSASIIYVNTLSEVFSSIATASNAWGVMPIENSIAGTVGLCQDGLAEFPLQVIYEFNLKISYALLCNTAYDAVELILAHPQAHDQCNIFISRNLAQAQVIYTNSNTHSGGRFLELKKDHAVAAIVPMEYSQDFDEYTVAKNIQSYADNKTRFLVIKNAAKDDSPDHQKEKTSLLIEPDSDRPGILYEILKVFNDYKVNLLRLESRPNKRTAWNYKFFIDINNNNNLNQCIAKLRQIQNKVRILGSYDILE